MLSWFPAASLSKNRAGFFCVAIPPFLYDEEQFLPWKFGSVLFSLVFKIRVWREYSKPATWHGCICCSSSHSLILWFWGIKLYFLHFLGFLFTSVKETKSRIKWSAVCDVEVWGQCSGGSSCSLSWLHHAIPLIPGGHCCLWDWGRDRFGFQNLLFPVFCWCFMELVGSWWPFGFPGQISPHWAEPPLWTESLEPSKGLDTLGVPELQGWAAKCSCEIPQSAETLQMSTSCFSLIGLDVLPAWAVLWKHFN